MKRFDSDESTLKELKAQLNPERMPQHVAIIMDGNGRWAEERGMLRTEGHSYAIESIRSTVDAANEIGLKHLSLFAFSTENIERPQKEIDELFRLFHLTLDTEISKLREKGVRFVVTGDLDMLPVDLALEFKKAVIRTSDNNGLVLNMCVMYSGRHEIACAARKLAEDVAAGHLKLSEVSVSRLAERMCHPEIPDPDLLIRTSGELRISNFMLWQLAYTEFYFTSTLWPDFGGKDLLEAILDYQQRERRFGKV